MHKHMSHSLDSIPLHFGMRGPIFFGQFIHRLTYYFYMFYETKENNRIRHGTFIDILILIGHNHINGIKDMRQPISIVKSISHKSGFYHDLLKILQTA